MSTVGYVVVEYNQASGMPTLPDAPTLWSTPEGARLDRDGQAAETAQVGRRERHRVAAVTIIDVED